MSLENKEEEILPGAVVTTEEPLAKKIEDFDFANTLEEDTVIKVLRNYRKNDEIKKKIERGKKLLKTNENTVIKEKVILRPELIEWGKKCKHGSECLDSFDPKKTFDKLAPLLIEKSKSSTSPIYKIHSCDLVWCYSGYSGYSKSTKNLPKKSYQDLKHSYEKYKRLKSYANNHGFRLSFRRFTTDEKLMYCCNGNYNFWTSFSHSLSNCQPLNVEIIDINQKIPEIAEVVNDSKKSIFQRFLNFFKKLIPLRKRKQEY